MNCWILSSARSGSWFLCDLLNNTGQFENTFYEHMHFSTKIKRMDLPPICKVLRRHFLHFYKDEDKDEIEKSLPGLKYIWLHRNDNVSKAVSFYIASKTGMWIRQKPSLVNFNKEELLMVYEDVVEECRNGWGAYLQGSEYLFLDFEDLVSDPQKTLDRVMEYLCLKPCESYSDIVKVKHPGQEDMVRKLSGWVQENNIHFL